MKLVAVTIPIYKENITQVEKICLDQCIKVLNRYPVIFFAPQSLNTGYYEEYCEGKLDFSIRRFDDLFFNGITGYNELMLSKGFYKAFIDYKFILIYQLDVFVFRDELEEWCKSGYDYIGAPYAFIDMDAYPMKVLTKFRWTLKTMKKYFPGFYQFKQVGNGGLSLRNVRKTIFLLNFKVLQPKLWKIAMEDNYFQYWGNLMAPFFKLPSVAEAAKFSIELEPQRSFELIGEKLPFGCHAFMRYEPEFWKKYIEKEGYTLPSTNH